MRKGKHVKKHCRNVLNRKCLTASKRIEEKKFKHYSYTVKYEYGKPAGLAVWLL